MSGLCVNLSIWIGGSPSVLVPATEREFANLQARRVLNLVAEKTLRTFRASFHRLSSQLTILFALAIQGVAKFVEKASGLHWIDFSAGLPG
jgi:hypothetical protein